MFLAEIARPLKQPVTLFCDNQSAISVSKNDQYHAYTKHIDIHYHFLRDVAQKGLILIDYLPTKDMVVDALTKALPETKLLHLRRLFWMRSAQGGVLRDHKAPLATYWTDCTIATAATPFRALTLATSEPRVNTIPTSSRNPSDSNSYIVSPHLQQRDGISEALTRVVSAGIRDFTSQVQLIGEFPVHVELDYTIWSGKLDGNTEIAIKLLRPARTPDIQEELLQEFAREAILWSRAMHHDSVMPLIGVARLDESVALVSPWMEEGDLIRYLKSHLDAHVEQLFADIACGLSHLHAHNIVYGILRSSTILVSDTGRAQLCSFLVAHTQQEGDYAPTNLLNWRVDSLAVSHPEDKPFGEVGRLITTLQSDVFAFGTVIMEVLMERNRSGHPYSRRNSHVLRNSLEGNPERPQSLQGLSDALWSIVAICWKREAKDRPTMAEVARRMMQLAQETTSTYKSDTTLSKATTPDSMSKASPRVLRDISAEIQRLGDHPISGGGFCDLYLGLRLGSEKVALKLVRFFGATKQDQTTARRRFLSEAWLWAGFRHRRILTFYGVCEHGPLAYFMVSPFLENGNIVDYLGNIEPNADRRRLLSEAAEGLQYLHNRYPPIVHGDIKGANILVTDSQSAVLADFGLSKMSDQATTTTLQGAGSPRWMAPELVLLVGKGTGHFKTPKSDVYAFGHVMLEVFSDKLPFFDIREELHVLVTLLNGGRSPRPDGPVAERWLDDATWERSRRCTAVDPEERPDMETVVSVMHTKYTAD